MAVVEVPRNQRKPGAAGMVEPGALVFHALTVFVQGRLQMVAPIQCQTQ